MCIILFSIFLFKLIPYYLVFGHRHFNPFEWSTDKQTHSHSLHKLLPTSDCTDAQARAIVDALHNHPLGCSVTPELLLYFSLSLFIYLSLVSVFLICTSLFFFSHFLSYHTSFCLSSFLSLCPSILIEINIFYSTFLLIHPHINLFPCHPFICCIFCNS